MMIVEFKYGIGGEDKNEYSSWIPIDNYFDRQRKLLGILIFSTSRKNSKRSKKKNRGVTKLLLSIGKNKMDFLKDIVKEIGDDYTKLAADINDSEQYIDTGSLVFNGLVSGSIFGGVSSNKITAIAGESSTGKTFFSLAVAKNFLDTNPDAYVLYFDTESSITRALLESRNIDTKRFVVINVVTIEEFRTKALKAIDKYLQMPIEERKPCMFVLDSLGMLSTEKEITDALNDKQVRDMTKSQLVKGAFRMLTLKLGQANVPLIVTNHTYDVIGAYVPTKEMGGG